MGCRQLDWHLDLDREADSQALGVGNLHCLHVKQNAQFPTMHHTFRTCAIVHKKRERWESGLFDVDIFVKPLCPSPTYFFSVFVQCFNGNVCHSQLSITGKILAIANLALTSLSSLVCGPFFGLFSWNSLCRVTHIHELMSLFPHSQTSCYFSHNLCLYLVFLSLQDTRSWMKN